MSVIMLTLFGAYSLACSYVYVAPSLPSVEAMRKVEMQVPLRVFTTSGELIAQIGEQRRIPVTYDQIPPLVREAFLAAEDDQFFTHGGVDYLGILRAVVVNLVSNEKAQGASTITQQAARNMFLTLDKTWRRKLAELFVTWRMEREFSKQEILGLYLNVIYFGQRAYGVAAAAEAFFGKSLDDLTVSEAATLAGVPQAPSKYNPITNPEFATARRGYVLGRMHKLGFIDDAAYEDARKTAVIARTHAPLSAVEAPYVAEMARLDLRSRFGPAAEAAGYRVYTTIDGRLQTAANRAVRLGLVEYDRRHGWRGPIGHADITGRNKDEQFEEVLEEYTSTGFLIPAVVVSETDKNARVFVRTRGFAQIAWDGLSWARKEDGSAPKTVAEIMAPGDVVYVVTDGKGTAQLGQVPEAQSALVSLNPNDGGIVALVGGFDYFSNKYNRVTQARRQPGSGFKPFLYSAALQNGFTPASVLLDAPIVVEDGETTWRPKNDSGQFNGPTRLREALYRSRNLVSIRLLRAMDRETAIDYITRFGFLKRDLPSGDSLALGTVSATPLQLATGYSTFANGGFKIVPHYIDRIENAAGEVVYRATPKIACETCEHDATLATYTGAGTTDEKLTEADALRGGRGSIPPEQLAERVITPQNDWLMTDMMMDVIKRGTGVRARALGRADIAGKTGTTNIGGSTDSKDVWFNGFTPSLVATVWVGFDQETGLGDREQGSNTALPIWMHFMREALRGVPEYRRPMPEGLVTLRISPDTGMLASGENPDAIQETFMTDHLPAGSVPGEDGPQNGPETSGNKGAEPGIF
ncbi:MAG: penicillin-binding protein 1A [Gammaproteobacteria bacterium]